MPAELSQFAINESVVTLLASMASGAGGTGSGTLGSSDMSRPFVVTVTCAFELTESKLPLAELYASGLNVSCGSGVYALVR